VYVGKKLKTIYNMRLILSALIAGFIFMWMIDNAPDMLGYIVVGLFIIFFIKLLKGKR
jgi:hypothetical protein